MGRGRRHQALVALVATVALGGAGGGAAPATAQAPRITQAPPTTTSQREATFRWELDPVPGAVGARCVLDARPPEPCPTPTGVTWRPLGLGAHLFTVQGTSATGSLLGLPSTHAWTVVPRAPTVVRESASPTRDRETASFAITASDAGAELQCAVDAGTFRPCPADGVLRALGLADGAHVLRVVAVVGGLTSPVTEAGWTVDTSPPGAPRIASGPPAVTNDASSASFVVEPPAEAARTECRLDSSGATAWVPCAGAITFPGPLAAGVRTFTARAVDAAGNATAATSTWTIDVTPPRIALAEPPPRYTRAASVRFAGVSADEPATLECRLTGEPVRGARAVGAWAPCGTGFEIGSTRSPVAEGAFSLAVRGRDAAGNVTPAGREATTTTVVDRTAPRVRITLPEAPDLRFGVAFRSPIACDDEPEGGSGGASAPTSGVDPSACAGRLRQARTSVTALLPNDRLGADVLEVGGVRDRAGNAAVGADGRPLDARRRFVVQPSPYARTVLADRPVGFWRLDDDAGSGPLRSVARGSADGQLRGARTGVRGAPRYGAARERSNPATAFTGNAGSYGYVNGLSAPREALTLEAWVRPQGATGTVVSQGGGAGLVLRDGRPAFRLADREAAAGRPLALGRWTHLAGTWDGTRARLYVDGRETASVASNTAPSGAAALQLGGGDGAGPLRGTLDEVALFDRALPAATLAGRVALARHRPPPTLVLAGRPRASIDGGTIGVDPGGTVLCPPGARGCPLRATLRRAGAPRSAPALARFTATVPAGRTVRASFRLSAAAAEELRRARRLRVTATLVLDGPGGRGAAWPASRTFILSAAR